MFAPKLKCILLHKIIATLKKYLCVSTAQCARVCFSGGYFADDVMAKRMVPIAAPIAWPCPGIAAIAS